jgi:hypothetical protein
VSKSSLVMEEASSQRLVALDLQPVGALPLILGAGEVYDGNGSIWGRGGSTSDPIVREDVVNFKILTACTCII